ncbi:MAG: DegT/DnrJ/EryC1/StrS family aminotransferase [Actinomycetota bacterium]
MSMRAQIPDSERPAIAGGAPLFPEGLPVARPSVPDPEVVAEDVKKILTSRMLTNGAYVRELEARAAEYLGVRACVAVSSCTSGLMLVLRASDISGDVVTPSFTFAATAHAIAWNGLRPVFAEVDEDTLTLSPDAAAHAVGVRTSAILATHTYGTPCAVEELTEHAHRHGIKLFFDAAHGFGSLYKDAHVGGFGDAEVFSLSPTKLLVASEGGIIATNDELLAERCRIGRDYGNPGDYDCLFVGLNARMSEIHAAVALASFDDLEDRVARRNAVARLYTWELKDVDGIRIPGPRLGDRSTYKDFTILVDEPSFGMDADALALALKAEGIDTRRYFSPPVHEMVAYRSLRGANGHMPATEAISAAVLTLPMWDGISDEQVAGVAAAIRRISSYRRAS